LTTCPPLPGAASQEQIVPVERKSNRTAKSQTFLPEWRHTNEREIELSKLQISPEAIQKLAKQASVPRGFAAAIETHL